VAILATFWFLKQGDSSTTLQLAEILLRDRHDLIQKAVGWMLRELGKQVDSKLLLQFLDAHAHEMPRTMLRYSIERLSPTLRAHYMVTK
jgi:3-methyladenine DNA glycosylase AlkD